MDDSKIKEMDDIKLKELRLHLWDKLISTPNVTMKNEIELSSQEVEYSIRLMIVNSIYANTR